MSADSRLRQLFEESPLHWGLRGDPYLWEALSQRLAEEVWPKTEAELLARLRALFEELSGGNLDGSEPIYADHLAHGGMSSGLVSPDFWRDVGFPHLLDRYVQLNPVPFEPPPAQSSPSSWVEGTIIGFLLISGVFVAVYLWQNRADLPLTVKEAREAQEAKERAEAIHQTLQKRGDVKPE
jgi:hypothetical protein